MISEYEKEIRIDQHQSSRKGAKLKLKSDKDSLTDNSVQSASQPQHVDAALKELYASLGEAAVNPFTVEKDEAGSSVSKTTVTSKGKEKEAGEKRLQSSQETLMPYEVKRREMIELFPTMVGRDIMYVDAEAVDLLPSNSIPSRKTYRISIDALEYYSIYETRHHYHYENQTHRNFNKKDSWNHSRNARWGPSADDTNWRSRDDSHYSYGSRERDNRWQQSRSQRDSHAMWREERNGRWGSGSDPNLRHRSDPEPDMGFRDRYGDSECSMGFRDRHSDSSQPQDQGDQIDYSVWPEWKRKRRRKYRQQGRDSYPSCVIKVSRLCL